MSCVRELRYNAHKGTTSPYNHGGATAVADDRHVLPAICTAVFFIS